MGSKHVVGAMDEAVATWVCAQIPGMDLGDTPYTAIGQLDGLGNIVGGAVFNNYTRRDIHIHVAGISPRWLTRRFLGECFRYVFLGLGCRRCTGLVAASNSRAQRFDEGLGFVYEGTLRGYLADDEDCLIYGMLREECRWLAVGELHGSKRQLRPAGPTIAGLQRREHAAATVHAPLRRSTGL